MKKFVPLIAAALLSSICLAAPEASADTQGQPHEHKMSVTSHADVTVAPKTNPNRRMPGSESKKPSGK